MTPLFLRKGSLSLGATRRLLIVLPPLKNTGTPCFLHTFFRLSLKPFGIRNNHIRSLGVCSVASGVVGASFVVVLPGALGLEFYSVESSCWVLALARTLCRCSSS